MRVAVQIGLLIASGIPMARLPAEPPPPPPPLTRQPVSQRVLAGHSTSLIGGSSDPLATYHWERAGLTLPDRLTPDFRFFHVLPDATGTYQLVARNRLIGPDSELIQEMASARASIEIVIPPQAPGVIDLGFSDPGLAGGQVRAIVPINDGGALVVGSFDAAGSWPVGSIVRQRPDGTVDPDFISLPGADGSIRAATAHGNGFVLGGSFTSYHDTGRPRLVRVHSDGKLDESFIPPPITSAVRMLATQEFGGETCLLVGLSSSPWLLRLHEDGRMDNAFGANLTAAALNGRINAVSVAPEGSIVIGGLFSVGPFTNLARLLPEGRPDTAGFRGGTGPNAEVLTVTHDARGLIVAGGAFTRVHGLRHRHLVRLLATGDVDGTFLPEPDDNVHAVAGLSDGGLVVAGAFERINGTPVLSVALLTPTGAPDPAWQPSSFDAPSSCLAIGLDDRLFVGGDFDQPHRGLVALRGRSFSEPPRILTTISPQDLTLGMGGTIRVNALVPPGSSYIWHKAGQEPPAPTTTQRGELIVPRATAADAGTYVVEIVSPFGTTTTNPIEVRVHPRSAGERPHWRGLPSTSIEPPDQGRFIVPLSMPAIPFADEVQVTLALDHTDTNDLVIELLSPGPNGKRVTLVNPDEPSPDGMRSGKDFDFTVFADQAPMQINEAASPYIGTYRPSVPLSTLRGTHPAGTWSLIVEDRRDDGIIGQVRFAAIDVFGQWPTIDADFINQHALPADRPELSWRAGTHEAWFRHWQPLKGSSPVYERAHTLTAWSPLAENLLRRYRREDDQTAIVVLVLPDDPPPACAFLRATWK